MSTRSPRNGTPSASSRARWRAPLASEPSARTTRHHGRPGSSSPCRHRAGEARSARGDVAVGADEALRDRADALERRRSARLIVLGDAPWDVFNRGPRPADGRARRRGPVALVLGRPAVAWARPGSGRSRRSPSPSPRTARRAGPAGGGVDARAGARRAARCRRARRSPPGRRDRRRGTIAVHTGAGLHRRTRATSPASAAAARPT